MKVVEWRIRSEDLYGGSLIIYYLIWKDNSCNSLWLCVIFCIWWYKQVVTMKNHSEDLDFNFKTTPPQICLVYMRTWLKLRTRSQTHLGVTTFFLMDSFRNPIKLHFRDPMKLHCPILDQNLCGCLFFPSLEWNRISWQLGHFQRKRGRERWGKGGLCLWLLRGRSQWWWRWWWISVLWLRGPFIGLGTYGMMKFRNVGLGLY